MARESIPLFFSPWRIVFVKDKEYNRYKMKEIKKNSETKMTILDSNAASYIQGLQLEDQADFLNLT